MSQRTARTSRTSPARVGWWARPRTPRWWPGLTDAQARGFQLERSNAEQARLKRNILIGAGLYASFAAADFTTITDIVAFALIMRLAVVTPLILVNYPLRSLAHRRGHPEIAEVFVASTALMVQVSIAVLMVMTHSPHAQAYFSGFFPILVYFALTLRVRLPLALATMTSMGVVAVAAVQSTAVIRPEIAQETSLVLVATVVLLGVMLVTREVDLRQAFLLKNRLGEVLEEREAGLVALQEANCQLAELTELDELTRLPNRRALQARLDEWDAQAKSGAVAMIDVDHFKVFNDAHGHATGDECLRLVAAAMKQRVRADGGFVGRYGGEEFTLLLPGADPQAAAAVTERLRESVESCDFHGLRVTISIGWACSDPLAFVPSTRLLQRADDAVLGAKAAGRNCVVRWELAKAGVVADAEPAVVTTAP